MRKLIRTCFGASWLVLGLSTAGCIGRSQCPPCPPCPGDAPAAATTGATAKACPGGVRIAADGLIDDLEDGNTQLSKLDNRDGYWWRAHDEKGSVIMPDEVTPVEAGPGGTGMAMYFHGHTVSTEGAWGVNFGANLSTAGTYDGSKYVGITFKAKVGSGSTKKVRFKVGDVNTHKDAGVCKECWNHFGKDMTFTTEWQPYQVLFTELRQADGWGDPRPPSITVDKLYSIDWSIEGGANFEIWVDDVNFLECQ
jgi:hypothetical protein